MNTNSGTQTGYTLPVFAIAAAKAALLILENSDTIPASVSLDLISQPSAEIPVAQCACLDSTTALAITLSNPGDNLDLTAQTPLWAWVKLELQTVPTSTTESFPAIQISPNLILEAGEGLGYTATGEPAIYKFARELAEVNLQPLIPSHTLARVRIILPEGRSLASRTSNAAFGILEGLALLGTSGISQPLSVEDKLEDFRRELQAKAKECDHLVFCIGANGYHLALRLGFVTDEIVQTANWLGVMLVEAALLNVQAVTLIGYHGKLLKLAGGIFNTSSHLADGRIEILTTAAVRQNLPSEVITAIAQAVTAEAVHKLLVQYQQEATFYQYLANQVNQKAMAYVHKYTQQSMQINTIFCDRLGNVISQDA